MPVWLIVEEETRIAGEGAPRRQLTVLDRLTRNRTRTEALAELDKRARRHRPDSLKGVPYTVARDADGTFWYLPKSGKPHSSCALRLMEEIRR
ncbi:hypothetical protein ACFY15_16955 [Streptomyces sp. NPDC001373]|uniref:hypothetical protein n=1 Tax=Streptomyces sp. NPDC001373 TaxID=3364565 RepID=UPI0036B03ED3